MIIEKGNEPKRRISTCHKCGVWIEKNEKRILDRQLYWHISCYFQELKRHLKWFDRIEKSGLKWRKEKAQIIKRYGDELLAEAL